MPDKPKIGMYWAAACGGCEISLVNIHEKILNVAAHFDFIFCPCLLDTKKSDIEAMPDKSLLITFFNGGIRTEENAEMALLLRKKSQILIAFGSCSYEGCIPALANLSTREELLRTVYLESPSTPNPGRVIPQPVTSMPEGEIFIPGLQENVRTLAQVVDVDFTMPGCPPEPKQIWNVIEYVISGQPLPPKGSILGAGKSAVCDECTKKKGDKKISRFYRTYEIIPDTETCLLEQGIVCMGIATRDGCGALCPKVNMPCTGCYGPPDGVQDQGARMCAALGSIIDIEEHKTISDPDAINRHIDAVLDTIPDFAGTFYKYSLADSLLKGGRHDQNHH